MKKSYWQNSPAAYYGLCLCESAVVSNCTTAASCIQIQWERNRASATAPALLLAPRSAKSRNDIICFQGNRLIYIYSRYDEANPNLKEQGDIILYADEVLHIPGLGFDGLVGYSPIPLAKNAIGISIVFEEYGASFFENGVSPSGVPEHPGVIKNPERVRDAWQRAYGVRNAHKVAVLEEGLHPDRTLSKAA